MKLNQRFRNQLQLVAANDNVYVYRRKLNQNPTYFLMSGSQIIRVGGRKHIMEQFRKLRPAYGNTTTYVAS